MKYLKHLPKHDLTSLLEIAHDASSVRSLSEFHNCFSKMKSLILFDGAIGAYVDKQAIDKQDKKLNAKYDLLNFSKKFVTKYLKNDLYKVSPVFQSVYRTWKPQHWKTAWSMGKYGHGKSTMHLAQAYGYQDGWMHAIPHIDNSTLSLFAFAGKKVEKDKRTMALLEYIIPHISESLKNIFQTSFAMQTNSIRFKLTKRELEVLKWLSQGKSSWETSVILSCSERVVKWHVRNIKQKLDAVNRTQAVAIAIRLGII